MRVASAKLFMKLQASEIQSFISVVQYVGRCAGDLVTSARCAEVTV